MDLLKNTSKKASILSFLFVLLSVAVVHADVYEIDSINKLYVKNARLARIRIDSLQRRCEESDYRECSRSQLEIVYSLICSYLNEPALSIKHANNAYLYSSKDRYYGDLLTSLQILIDNELNLGFNKLAVEHTLLLKKEAEKSPEIYRGYFVPTALKYLSLSYSKNEIGKCNEMLDEAIRISKGTSDEYILFYEISIWRAKCYLNVKDYARAEQIFIDILRHLKSDSKYQRGHIDKVGYDIHYLNIYTQLAIVYVYLNRNTDAEITFNKAMALYEKYPDVPEVKNRIAQYLLLTCQYDELDKFVEPLIDTSVQSKEMLQLMQMLLQSYLVQGNETKAKNLYPQYISLDDTIKLRTSDCAIEELNIAYNTSQLQKKIALQKTYLAFGSTILVLLSFIVVSIIIYNRRLKRLYKSALQRIEEFMEQQKEITLVNESNKDRAAETEYEKLFLQLDERIKRDKPYLDFMFGRDELAVFANLDKNKLTEVIKAGAKVTPSKYLNQLRIVCSIELLKTKPGYSIEAIAKDSGFGTRTTFYRVFTDTFGITPKQFREKIIQ
jgi:AraC-like DNA-binding protein